MTATITPAEVARLMKEGAVLVDIREGDERARLRIPGSRHAPLSRGGLVLSDGAEAVIFHCRSGNRTAAHAARLAAAAPCRAYILEGGIEGWRRAGLPIEADAKAPLEIMRQVQIIAGALILMGVLLGALVAPGFYAVSAFVGAGLLTAGVTGWCGMARLLAVMPWNRVGARA